MPSTTLSLIPFFALIAWRFVFAGLRHRPWVREIAARRQQHTNVLAQGLHILDLDGVAVIPDDRFEKGSNGSNSITPKDRAKTYLQRIIALTGALVLSGATLAQPGVDTQSKANPSGSVMQPQGMTGPINTKSGGAPASSPQGETPAGMQAAPKGSSETILTDKHGIVEGTPKN